MIDSPLDDGMSESMSVPFMINMLREHAIVEILAAWKKVLGEVDVV